jgi:hypothetical protein
MRECFGEISPRPSPQYYTYAVPRRMEQLVDPKTVAMRRATEDGLGEGGIIGRRCDTAHDDSSD